MDFEEFFVWDFVASVSGSFSVLGSLSFASVPGVFSVVGSLSSVTAEVESAAKIVFKNNWPPFN